MAQLYTDIVPNDAPLHRGMVPVSRSRSRDALFEVSMILSSLERRRGSSMEFERMRFEVSRLERELPLLSLPAALERAEQLRRLASSLYERTISD